ncbi:MAG: hypothetical protein PVF73_00280 [Bacteroidales bacterium]|jgi:hypothetical protein
MRKIFVYTLLLLLLACEKEKVGVLDCNSFREGLLQENNETVRSEIEKLTPDLQPFPTPEDAIGHMTNVQTLTERINSNCGDFTASVLCYACIETYPPLSLIEIEFVSDGEPVSVTISIVTSENDVLRFGGL